jgi:20S proteasome subunit beta 7
MQSKIENPLQHSLGAVNVGSSVLAVKYRDGVMIAADTAISYGSMRKEKDARRIKKLSNECIYASSGEMADF